MGKHLLRDWIINQSLNHSKRTIIISLILTALIASGLKYFFVEDDMMKLLPKKMQTRQTWDKIKKEFGNTDVIFVAFGHQDKTIINQETMAKFWDFVKELESISDIEEVNCIITQNRMDNDDGFLIIDDLITQRDLSEEEIISVKNYLDRNPNTKIRFISSNEDYTNIMIKPYNSANLTELSFAIRDITEKHLKGYEIYYGGSPYVTGIMTVLIREDVQMLMIIGMAGMILILLLNLRSVPGVSMVLSVIFMSLLAMLGSMGWIYHITGSDRFVFSLINTSMPIIMLTIANSDGVHIMAKFFKKIRLLRDKREALTQTMQSLMLPVFLTSFTTVVAFLSMIYSPLEVQTGYGVSIAIGVIWAWFLSSTFLPSLILYKNWNLDSNAVKHASYLEKKIDLLGRGVIRRPKRVLATGLILVIMGLIGIFWLNVEVDIQSFFRKDSEIRQGLEFLDKQMVGTMDMQFRVEADIKDPNTLVYMEQLQEYLEQQPQVTTTISIADIIKQMHRTVMDDDPAFEIIPETKDKVNNLFTMYSMSGDPDDFSSLINYDYSVGLISAFLRNMSSKDVIQFVQNTENTIEKNGQSKLNMTITGMLMVFKDLIGLIVRSSFISITFSILAIALIGAYFFERLHWGILAVIPMSSAVILNFGLMGIFGVDLSHVTAMLSAIIIGVGVDFAIHYISQYKRFIQRGISTDVLSQEVVDDVGYPIVLDALSNMSFGALLFSQFLPIQHMGGLMVFSMIATSVGTLTLLAALAEIYKHKLIAGELTLNQLTNKELK